MIETTIQNKKQFFLFALAAVLLFAFACGKGGDPMSGSGADKLMNRSGGNKTVGKSKKSARTSVVELPKGPRWKSRVYRLRVRSAPTLKSEIVGHLHKGQLVVELERKKEGKTVAGRKGRWLKIQSEQNVVGWTFSGFLVKSE